MAKIQLEEIDGKLCANLHWRTYSIVEESRGVREKFWMKRIGKHAYHESPRFSRILFKFNRNDVSCEDWGEVFFARICNKVGVPCVTYYISQLYDEKGEFVGNGVMCGSYKKSNEEAEFSVYDLQMKNTSGITNSNVEKMNTVDGIIDCVKKIFEDVTEDEVKILRNDLIEQAIMDFLCCQTDRHWLNTTILVYDVLGKTHIRKAACYDNGCIAMLKRKQSAIEGMSREIGKDGKDSKYLSDKLSSYCPMFGIKSSLVDFNPEKDFSNRNEKIKVINPKQSREIFLDEVADEILYNPEIAVFFTNLKHMMENKGKNSLDIWEISKEIGLSGDHAPDCVTKMVGDVMGHQFDVLNERVHSRLKMFKEQEGM